MVLKLTPEVISMVIGAPTEKADPAWFNTETYDLYGADDEIPPAVSSEMLIEFPKVREIDVQRAYVNSLNDRALSNRFKHLTDEEFWREFWNTFDDGGLRLANYRAYEEAFYKETVKLWCRDNGIAYYIPDNRR